MAALLCCPNFLLRLMLGSRSVFLIRPTRYRSQKLAGFGCCLVAVVGGIQLIMSIPIRIAYNRDADPKLILSNDAFCDHRTGVMVELMDVDSIRLDQRTFKGNETKANLVLTMEDGQEHVFDLLQLDMPSEEIGWRVTTNAGIDPSKGVALPTEENLGPTGMAIGFALVLGVLWQIYQALN